MPQPIPGAIPGAIRESTLLLLFITMRFFLIREQSDFVRLEHVGNTASGGCNGGRNTIRLCGHVWL